MTSFVYSTIGRLLIVTYLRDLSIAIDAFAIRRDRAWKNIATAGAFALLETKDAARSVLPVFGDFDAYDRNYCNK